MAIPAPVSPRSSLFSVPHVPSLTVSACFLCCQAHTSYESAIIRGHQAFLLEEDMCSRDVFCCNVGNLLPGSQAEVTLKYVQELPLEADGALRYVLPAVLNPRYQLSGQSPLPPNTTWGVGAIGETPSKLLGARKCGKGAQD